MSLPYVDGNDRRVADALILEELRGSGGGGSRSNVSPARGEERAGKQKQKRIDQTRYALDAPTTQSLADWDAANQNALAQLEHQQNRLVNLELLQKHGPDAWRHHNEVLSNVVEALRGDVDSMKREIEELNQARKADQITCRESCAAFESARAEGKLPTRRCEARAQTSRVASRSSKPTSSR